MKKAIKITSYGAIILKALYLFLAFVLGTIGSFTANPDYNIRGYLLALFYTYMPIFFSTVVLAVLMVVVAKSRSNNIVAEILGLIYFSGVLDFFKKLTQLITDQYINKFFSDRTVYISFIGFNNTVVFIQFLTATASSLAICACTLSIVNKKVINKI